MHSHSDECIWGNLRFSIWLVDDLLYLLSHIWALLFHLRFPGVIYFETELTFKMISSIKSKCQNSLCHSASWSVDVTTQKHRTVCLVTFMDDIPRSADAKSSLSYSLQSLLLIFFLVQSVSLLFFPFLLRLGETSCFLTDVTYSPKSLFRSILPSLGSC